MADQEMPGFEDQEAFVTFGDNLPVLCWVADADGYITRYNHAWHAYCGTSPAEMEGWGWTKVHDPEILPEVMRNWESSIRTGAPFEMVFPLRGADGAYRHFLTRVRPARGPDGTVLRWFGVNIDVQAGREAAAALQRQAEERKVALAERTLERDRLWSTSPNLLLSLDKAGYLRSVSPSVTDILGFTQAEMVGRHVLDVVLPEDREITSGALAQARVAAVPALENRYRHKNGGIRWFSWVAAPEGELIFATGRDITAEKQADQKTRRAESRMRAVFETTSLIQGYIDLDGVLRDANPTAMALIDEPRDQVIGKIFWNTPWFSATPGVPEQVRAAFKTVLAGAAARQEITVNLPSGERSFDFSMRPVADETGRLAGVVPEATETTGQRAAEAARLRAEEALRQSQKMEAVGQLTGGIAHDFNNLLTGITGSLERMQTRIAQGRAAEIGRYVSAAQGAAQRATALIHRLLAFSRRQTLDPRPINVNRLVAGMEDLIRRTVGPGISLEVVGAAGLWATLADPNQLENALLNLAINARDSMPEGGRITIETANKWLDDRSSRERDLSPGQYLSLCVTDTGTGMTPEVIARAFDPFFTTKPLGAGTGLGLSMIYGFARQSGGQVRIYSELGEGTTMCIYLPRFLGPDEEPDSAPPEPAAAARQGETVLVVDDEPTVRMLIVEVLEEAGFVALEAETGAAGLKLLRSTARIDLLITDVGLPGGMNGRQMADAARVTRPGLKVLFITGYAENAVVGNGQLEQGMAVLTKPFAMDALATKVRVTMAG